MIKTKFGAVAAAVLLSLGAVGSASAFTISTGQYKFTIDNFDSGTTGYAAGCASVALCDASPGIVKAPGSVGSFDPSSDSMGIFSVALITRLSDNAIIFTKGGGSYITGIFGGLKDHGVSILGPFTQTFSEGGQWAMYETATDYDPTLGPGFVALTKDLNAPVGLYPGINASLTPTPYLSGVFGAGVSTADPTGTYTSLFDSATFAGNGQGYLDILAGTAKTLFDTTLVTDPNGGLHDMFLDVTFNDINGVAAANGWTVTSTGALTGNAIPEPGALALVAIALLGAGAASRRRRG